MGQNWKPIHILRYKSGATGYEFSWAGAVAAVARKAVADRAEKKVLLEVRAKLA